MQENSFKKIPYPYCNLFTHYGSLTPVQSAFFNDVLYSDKSIILCAPKGSGKTVAFELGIVQLLLHETLNWEQLKAVYVAPLKFLCSEVHNNWSSRFQSIGVKCIKLTGDSEVTDKQEIQDAQLIITTPEKWDIITRSDEYRNILNVVRLFMIDEVHLLDDNVRGPTIEVIISRMKIIQQCRESVRAPMRFIIASATIPNIEDIAVWIGTSMDVKKLFYPEEERPNRLQKHIIGVNSNSTGFKFDMSLNYKLANIIRKYSDGKSTLIFCNCRKSTEMAAGVLAKQTDLMLLSSLEKESLLQISQRFSDMKLKEAFIRGIAFHHAGMTYEDRSIIEDSFRKLLLKVLLCTNTLAMGVNLPVHLVIVKSTEYYDRGLLREYSKTTVLQMIGRANQVGCNAGGISVILTNNKNVSMYENLMVGRCFIESHLHRRLAEYLNAEVALRNITDLSTAMTWLRSTYLYVRMTKNPLYYGLQVSENKDDLEKSIEGFCATELEELKGIGLITTTCPADALIHATAVGEIMAKFHISLNTMKTLFTLRGNESYLELIALISHCQEFSEFVLRVGEKKPLNVISKSVRFPIKSTVKTREDKVFCLTQAELGCLQIQSSGLVQEAAKIIRIGQRLTKCLVEFIRASENSLCSGCYSAMLHAVTISKCFHANMWENSAYVSKQLRKVGVVYSSALVNAGKTTLKSISETEAQSIDRILNESHPFGEEVLQNVKSFPKYMIEIDLRSADSLELKVIQINSEYSFDEPGASLIVGDSSNNLLLYIANIDNVIKENSCFEQVITTTSRTADILYAHVVHNSIVGVDEYISVNLTEFSQVTSDYFPKRSLEALPYSHMPEKENLKSQLILKSKIAPNFRARSLQFKINKFSFAKSRLKPTLVQSKLTTYFGQRKRGRCLPFNRNNRFINFGTVMENKQLKPTESEIKTLNYNILPTNSKGNNILSANEFNPVDLSVPNSFNKNSPQFNQRSASPQTQCQILEPYPMNPKKLFEPKTKYFHSGFNYLDRNSIGYISEYEETPLNLTVSKPFVSKICNLTSSNLELNPMNSFKQISYEFQSKKNPQWTDDNIILDLVRDKHCNNSKQFCSIFCVNNCFTMEKPVRSYTYSNPTVLDKENLGDEDHYNKRQTGRSINNHTSTETKKIDLFTQDFEQFYKTSTISKSENRPEKSSIAKNPYRLQIKPSPANCKLNHKQIKHINKNVMSYVLTKKYEFNNK